MRIASILVLLLAVSITGCTGGVINIPIDPPPIDVPPPPPPPIDPPPLPPAPADVEAALARITVGMTVAEASTALGLGTAQQVPGTPATARWFLTVDARKWMIYVVLDTASRVLRKGFAVVETIP